MIDRYPLLALIPLTRRMRPAPICSRSLTHNRDRMHKPRVKSTPDNLSDESIQYIHKKTISGRGKVAHPVAQSLCVIGLQELWSLNSVRVVLFVDPCECSGECGVTSGRPCCVGVRPEKGGVQGRQAGRQRGAGGNGITGGQRRARAGGSGAGKGDRGLSCHAYAARVNSKPHVDRYLRPHP